MKNIKKYQIIEIDWYDSMHTSGWTKESDIELTLEQDVLHKTVGYFIKQNKVTLLVVQSRNNKHTYVDAIMEIPLKSIVRIKFL